MKVRELRNFLERIDKDAEVVIAQNNSIAVEVESVHATGAFPAEDGIYHIGDMSFDKFFENNDSLVNIIILQTK